MPLDGPGVGVGEQGTGQAGGGERHPAASGVVILVVEEERVAQAASGAPFASLAVTVATPGRLLANAMISSAVLASSFRAEPAGDVIAHAAKVCT